MTQRRSVRRWVLLGAVCALALAMGCGEDDGGDGGGDAPAADCQARCEAKLVECEVPEAQAEATCEDDVCSEDPTESQLSCAEGKSCQEVLTTPNICGIGADDDACPELMCDCNGIPVNGVIEVNGECARDCETACAALGAN